MLLATCWCGLFTRMKQVKANRAISYRRTAYRSRPQDVPIFKSSSAFGLVHLGPFAMVSVRTMLSCQRKYYIYICTWSCICKLASEVVVYTKKKDLIKCFTFDKRMKWASGNAHGRNRNVEPEQTDGRWMARGQKLSSLFGNCGLAAADTIFSVISN